MNWRQKAIAFWLLEYMPGGKELYYFLQRKFTKTLPRKSALYPVIIASAAERREQLLRAGSTSGKTLLEFGAGWDLFYNIALYCYGFDKQVVVDIVPLMRPELVDSVIQELKNNPPADATRALPQLLGSKPRETLKTVYGIDYLAPADARKLGFSDNSIDYVATTNTLEHIPFHSLKQILPECRRVLSPEGIMCMQIDYSDHFSHSDSAITPYNFLQFGEKEWRLYNPPKQHQNRRRHSDYRKLFLDAGYEIIHEEAFTPENWKAMLATIKLDPEFAAYDIHDVAVTSGIYVMRPNKDQ